MDPHLALGSAGPIAVVRVDPAPVLAATHLRNPGAMLEIPAHGALESGFEAVAGTETALALDAAGIDRVAQIMPWAIAHEVDQAQQLVATRSRLLRDERADLAHDVDVAPLRAPADVVGLAQAA